MSTRAVLLSACASPSVALQRRVAALCEQHAEVIVALDAAHDEPSYAPLPARWAAVRALLSAHETAWVTPLVATPSLCSLADQTAALTARLGRIDALVVDSPRWLPSARALGLQVELAANLSVSAEPVLHVESARSRALVVLRAQPFHLGHRALIERALALADEVVVVVAAAERAFAVRDPFTAGERLSLLRAGLGDLTERVWLVALPAPSWPAIALAQLAFVAPSFDLVVAHNPLLRALAIAQGARVEGLPALRRAGAETITATRIRAKLSEQAAGAWLFDYLPRGTAELLIGTKTLAERCALIAAAGA